MATPRRGPTISLGQGLTLGLVVVLIGAAWQLGEKMADMRVAQADSQGDVKALAVTVDSLARDLKDLRDEVRGIGNAKGK